MHRCIGALYMLTTPPTPGDEDEDGIGIIWRGDGEEEWGRGGIRA